MFKIVEVSKEDLKAVITSAPLKGLKKLNTVDGWQVFQAVRCGFLVLFALKNDKAIVVSWKGEKIDKESYCQMKKFLWTYMQDEEHNEYALYALHMEQEKKDLF